MQDENKKVPNNKARENKKGNRDKKEKKNNENTHLTYTIGDKLDILFPQYKPSKKKEESK